MKRNWLAAPAALLLALLVSAHSAQAAPASADLALRWSYKASSDTLTTEKVWILDPDEPNPHRQRWVLNRKVDLVDLKPREISGAKGGGSYGVLAGGLDAVTTAYYREDGPWYRPMGEFPCSAEPESWFGTLAGAHAAADVAAKDWERILEANRIKLAVMLRRVTGASPGAALEGARLLFDEWLKGVELQWWIKGHADARAAEWKHYQTAAHEHGLCTTGHKKSKATETTAQDEYVPPSHKGPVPWELMMERPATGDAGRAGTPIDETKILARAPAKLWDGLFSIRLNLTIAGRRLNGAFLVDSGSGTSVISPDFLNGQGILPAWVTVPGAPFRRVPWGGGNEGAGGLAPVVMVDQVEIGNTPVQIKDFALFDSEFFAPPDNASSCCDGVLGTDFLRHYVVELHPGPPAEVKLWPPENFHLEDVDNPDVASQWVETALTPVGEAVSTCTARLEEQGAKLKLSHAAETLRLVGVRWDTGREDALDVHLPWQAQTHATMGSLSNSWALRCGPEPMEAIARNVPASFPKPDNTPASAAIRARVPALSVGMELLGRGRVFFDFPHGRIWVPEKTAGEPVRRDESGLVLKYEFIKGKGDTRGLFARQIMAGTPAQVLAKRGLRPGMLITQVDKIDADDLDARQVRKHLAGVYGDQVYIQWKTSEGLKLGVMKVR